MNGCFFLNTVYNCFRVVNNMFKILSVKWKNIQMYYVQESQLYIILMLVTRATDKNIGLVQSIS